VNGTHLYKRFSKKLLIAVAFDTDNEIFLLAYAPIEEENNVNWRWFSLLIQHHITGDLSGICIILDMHVSIKHEMTTNWLELIGYHQYCVRHLASNFNHKFKDLSAKKKLFRMCYESSKCKFDVWFDDMGNSHL
jgi:hypothetical protein